MKKIAGFFGKVFGWLLTDGATAAAEAVQKISIEALPIVDLIASLTPTRADDEIVATFRRFGVPLADFWLSVPQSRRGPALLELATEVLRKDNQGAPTHQLQAAAQNALVLLRAGVRPSGPVIPDGTLLGDVRTV